MLRRLTKPEEFRAAEEVATRVGVPVGEAPVPVPVLSGRSRTMVASCSARSSDIYLAGFTFGFLGWDGQTQTLHLYSQLTAVRPEYQNHHVGRRLKLRQREEVLALGLGEIRWTFDPLLSHQAFLVVRRLGAVPDRYLVHYYGRGQGDEDATVPSDRLRTIWKLGDPRVEQRVAGTSPSRESDLGGGGIRNRSSRPRSGIRGCAHRFRSRNLRPHGSTSRSRSISLSCGNTNRIDSDRGELQSAMPSEPRLTWDTRSRGSPW